MAEAQAQRELPLKWPLFGAAMLIAGTMGLIVTTRLAGGPTAQQHPQATAPVAFRELRFEDRADGGIDVIDGRTRSVVVVLEPGGHGFIRGVLRAFARDRMLRQLDSGPTFLIAQYRDGAVSIQDTATRHTIALNGFGQSNAGAFVRLIDSGTAKR